MHWNSSLPRVVNDSTYLVGPVPLLVVEIPQIGFETPAMRRCRVHVASQVPLAHHVRLVASVVQVLRHNLDARDTTGQGSMQKAVRNTG